MKIVHVFWDDSTQVEPGWQDLAEAMTKTVPSVESVGYLVNETTDLIILAQSWDEELNMVEGVSTIPRSCVREIIEILI